MNIARLAGACGSSVSPRSSLRLPCRALVKKKKQANQKPKEKVGPPQKIVPYLPAETIKDTIQFFQTPKRVAALLEIVYPPVRPKDTAEDRKHYEHQYLEYNREKKKFFDQLKKVVFITKSRILKCRMFSLSVIIFVC